MSNNMMLDMSRSVFDLQKHKVGTEATGENPKYESEVQSLCNLIDWQVKHLNVSDKFDHYVGRFKDPETGEDITNPNGQVKLEREKFKVQLFNRKNGFKLARRHTIHKFPRKLPKAPQPEMSSLNDLRLSEKSGSHISEQIVEHEKAEIINASTEFPITNAMEVEMK